jgi:glycosyltransferase involved in cell wall biosynthesis
MRLVMIGDGSLFNEVKNRVSSGGISELSWLPGHREDIPELMAQFDLFVLPSKAEGISNTILEAMASGLPVIATDVGGNSELLSEGENAMLVPASDSERLSQAMLRYADERPMIVVHGNCSRAMIERSFSLDAMVHNYMQVYDEVLA